MKHVLVSHFLLSYRPGPCRFRWCSHRQHGQKWFYRCSCGTEGSATQAFCGEDVEAKVKRHHRAHAARQKKSDPGRGVIAPTGHITHRDLPTATTLPGRGEEGPRCHQVPADEP